MLKIQKRSQIKDILLYLKYLEEQPNPKTDRRREIINKSTKCRQKPRIKSLMKQKAGSLKR
jgi:hypothetical protein